MGPFRYHAFICNQEKPDPSMPSCASRGSRDLMNALRAELERAGIEDDVLISTSGCPGLCMGGPNMVVYPEGAWYGRIQEADIPEIVQEHFVAGRPVSRLANDPGAVREVIVENNRRFRAMMKSMQQNQGQK